MAGFSVILMYTIYIKHLNDTFFRHLRNIEYLGYIYNTTPNVPQKTQPQTPPPNEKTTAGEKLLAFVPSEAFNRTTSGSYREETTNHPFEITKH